MFSFLQNFLFKIRNFIKIENNLKPHIINKELSLFLYNNYDHVGEEIDVFELKDLLEPNICRLFHSRM
tara:strand:- start:203 stop:406 length:204 start_codon:yes stop_codon:yes gene_type:complete